MLRTATHDEANNHFSQFFESASIKLKWQNVCTLIDVMLTQCNKCTLFKLMLKFNS
jgi:hypothetical protein